MALTGGGGGGGGGEAGGVRMGKVSLSMSRRHIRGVEV